MRDLQDGKDVCDVHAGAKQTRILMVMALLSRRASEARRAGAAVAHAVAAFEWLRSRLFPYLHWWCIQFMETLGIVLR